MDLKEEIDDQIDPEKIVGAVGSTAVFPVPWRSRRTMHSEYGAHGGYGGRTDTYTQVRQAGREAFHEAAKPLVSEIKDSFARNSTDDDVKAVTDSYLMSLDSIFLAEIVAAGEKFESWALNKGFYPQSDDNRFWTKVNELHGRGYQRRVGDQYEHQVTKYEDDLCDIVYDGMVRMFDRLLESMPRY